MNIEDKIKNALKEDNIPEIKEQKLTELIGMVKENRLKPKRRLLPRIVAIASSVLVLAVGTIIALSTLNKPDEIRYSDLDDNIKQQITQEEIINYLPDDLNFPTEALKNLSFEFANLYILDSTLLALEANYIMLDAPYTSIRLFFNLSDKFDFNEHNSFIENSIEEYINETNVYSKEFNIVNEEVILKTIIFKKYKIYLRFMNTESSLISEILNIILT